MAVIQYRTWLEPEEVAELGKSFLDALEKRRLELGWTPAELCRQAGCAHSIWTTMNKDHKSPKLLTVIRFCKAVGLEVKFEMKP